MFFSISKDSKDNFPHHYNFGNFIVNTDNGWKITIINNIQYLYKGYTDIGNIEDNLPQIITENFPTFLGNFCVIGNNKIVSDLYRSFPITYDNMEITNLKNVGHSIWCDNCVKFDDELNVTETHNDVIGKIDSSTITEETAISQIDRILSEKTIEFLKYNTKPLKVFLSGGVDSLLVYSYIQKYTKNYELILNNHIDFDYFWLKNSNSIENYWGYRQIHHWNNDCVLTSGAPGDEFMLRSPNTANIFCRYYNTSITKLLKEKQFVNCLHHNYFSLEKHTKLFKQHEIENLKFNNLEETIKFLCNINANDFQHWHLGNTLTWTPLRDLEIFKILLRLDFNTASHQIMNSTISKKLIERNNPNLIKLISDSKNHENYLSNLVYLLN